MIADLDKLIELQQTDTNLRRLKDSVETSETRRAEIEQEFEQHAFSIREIQNRRDSMHAKRADLEKQIAENKIYLERADRNLKHAQNSKEYETAMRETDALQKAIAAFETQIVEAMETVEAVDKEIEERSDEIATLDRQTEIMTVIRLGCTAGTVHLARNFEIGTVNAREDGTGETEMRKPRSYVARSLQELGARAITVDPTGLISLRRSNVTSVRPRLVG